MVYISAVITSIFDCKMLQSDLDGLILWSNEWAMKLNIDKCKILIVINKKNNYLSIKNTICSQNMSKTKIPWKNH